MNQGKISLALFPAMVLFGIAMTGMVYAQINIKAATDIAELARQENIVTLSLVCAICAMGFSAWLVKLMTSLARDAITAINNLSDDLRKRPCIYKGK